MLLQRTLTALLLAPLAILLILLAPQALFAGVIAVAFLAALWEWTRLSGLRDRRLRGVLLALAGAVFALLWWQRGSWLWPLLIAAGALWWVVAALWLRRFAFGAAPTSENRSLKLLAGAFAIVPAWVAGMYLHNGQPYGPWWTMLALAIVWAADIGAYFSGRFFGRRKLAPRISPGKTWAGVYGALAAGALVALLGGWLLQVRGWPLLGLLVLAMISVASSIVGDLFESLMKRHAEVKDSGTLFPGHGGLLDRLDSVFAALPVFAIGLWLLGL